MSDQFLHPVSSVIISVYKDDIALRLILKNLASQTVNNFNVIVSEDGCSHSIKDCIDNFNHSTLQIKHLSQKDDGFRKNMALNRAIVSSTTDHLIFIDGDCIPHTGFVSAHQKFNHPGIACTGRRLELGKSVSLAIRNAQFPIARLTHPLSYLLHTPALIRDKAKNIESGLYSRILHRFTSNRDIRLLGCNFSCNKNDLLAINGFNEDYKAPGIGEDSDIDWRLQRYGVKIANVKFSAIQYHLYHPRMYQPSTENQSIFDQTKKADAYITKNGIRTA